MLPAALGLAAGIALDSAVEVPILAALPLFAMAGAVLLARRGSTLACHGAVVAAALVVGTVLHGSAWRHWPDDHIIRYGPEEPVLVRLTGTVLDRPVARPASMGRVPWFATLPRTRMLVDAETIADARREIPVSGRVTVFVREPVLHVQPGDRVSFTGTLHRVRPAMNPHAPDFARVKRRRGILVELSCRHASGIRVIAPGAVRSWGLAGWRDRVRAAMLDETYRGDRPGARILAALVLGQRSAVDNEVTEAFIKTGTIHYLSVSGAHVGMLASVVWLGGLVLGGSRRKCAAAAMVLVTVYAVLAEPRPAILRAAVMTDLACIAMLLRRPLRNANWLPAAAIILLTADPMQLFEPGFQLSFLTILSIMFVSPRLREAGARTWRRVRGRQDPLFDPAIQRQLNPPSLTGSRVRRFVRSAFHRLGRILSGAFGVSVAAWLVSLPLSAWHFHEFAPWGWLNSVLVVPLVWLTLVLGFAKAVLSTILPQVSPVLAWPLSTTTEALLWSVEHLAALPGSGLAVPALPGWVAASWLAVMMLWAARRSLGIPRWAVPVSALMVVVLLMREIAPPAPGDTLEIEVLAVGSGTAVVMSLPDGDTMLYDIGASPPYDLEQWTVGPVLSARRTWRVDAMIISHPNLDHYSGLPDLLARRNVRAIIVSEHFAPLAATSRSGTRLNEVIADAGARPLTAAAGDRLTHTGEVAIEVLWPPPLDQGLIEDANDSSLVLRIGYAGRTVLLTGDIGEMAQRRLIEQGGIAADVLLLPHHGSIDVTTPAFIDAVNPAICIRSSGQSNRRTKPRLFEIIGHRQYYNTADDGAVTVRLSPDRFDVWSHRK